MFTEADLLAAIDRHLATTKESAAGFGKRIANDPNLVSDLREGRSPRMRLAQQIMAAIGAPGISAA
jgi:hypothetical protein